MRGATAPSAGAGCSPRTLRRARVGRRHPRHQLLGPARGASGGGAPVRRREPQRLLGPALNGDHDGLYRGAIEIRTDGGGVTAINVLDLDTYVRGVVAGEMPRSWPLEALKAQAVAARTYALATRKTDRPFDQYPDTRSQVYRGVTGESVRTNAAVATRRAASSPTTASPP